MVESPQLPLKYHRKTNLDAIRGFDMDLKYRFPPCLRFPSDDAGARSPITSSSSIAPSSPLLDLRTPDPPSSPLDERHGQHIVSSPKSFWEVAFNYGPDFPYKPRMAAKAPSTRFSEDSFNSRRRSSSASAPWLVTDMELSEYSEGIDSDTPHSCDEIAETCEPSDQVRLLSGKTVQRTEICPRHEGLDRGEDSLQLENFDVATILLALSRQPRISPYNGPSSCSVADSNGAFASLPGEIRGPPCALPAADADMSATSDLPQTTSSIGSDILISAHSDEVVGALRTTGTLEGKIAMNDSGMCQPLLHAERDDGNLQVPTQSGQMSKATISLDCHAQDVQGIAIAKPSSEEIGKDEISSGSADIAQLENREQSDDISSRSEIGDDDIPDDPISAEIFSNPLTPLSSPVEAPSDLDKDESAETAPIMHFQHDLSELPCPSSSLDARHDGEKENLPVNPDELAVLSPFKPRSASILGLAISVDHNEGKAESGEASLRPSASDITMGIAKSVVGERSRKRPLTSSGKLPSALPTMPPRSDADVLRPPTKSRKTKHRSTEQAKSDGMLLPSDETSKSRVTGSPVDESEDIDESSKNELHGCLIQAMALSRASSMPASSLLRVVLRENPHLEHQHTQESWLKVAEEVLKSHDVFGRIDRKGLDADDKPLEAQWFYIPEKDPDQERASLLREMMPKKRNETKKHKQYFFKPPGKGSKWDTEYDN